MSAWWRRANDRAVNLGMSAAQLARRVHGQTQNREMVELTLALEETLQKSNAAGHVLFLPKDTSAGELVEQAAKLARLARERTGRPA
jgi:hypothetical protein